MGQSDRAPPTSCWAGAEEGGDRVWVCVGAGEKEREGACGSGAKVSSWGWVRRRENEGDHT
jgi:hypothetical protein